MEDLIKRQAAIDAFDCSVGGVPVESVKYVSEYADKMMSRIKALPSAQPEIIRCKECESYTEIRHVEGGTIGKCEILGLHTCDRWFCGNAERRSDG